MPLPITAATAAVLAVMLLLLAYDTVRNRMRLRVAHGLTDDAKLTSASRAHGNLSEHAPIVLIMLGLLENSGANILGLEIIAAAFVVVRIAHVHGLYNPRPDGPPPGRVIGVAGTWIVLLALAVWIVVRLLG